MPCHPVVLPLKTAGSSLIPATEAGLFITTTIPGKVINTSSFPPVKMAYRTPRMIFIQVELLTEIKCLVTGGMNKAPPGPAGCP